ncbi:hypothetical protein B0T21DRAFT_451263, partial [Apiosordaria backusii]
LSIVTGDWAESVGLPVCRAQFGVGVCPFFPPFVYTVRRIRRLLLCFGVDIAVAVPLPWQAVGVRS